MLNIVRLFRADANNLPGLPLPYPDQARVDRIATGFMRLAASYLLVGLGIGVITEIHKPSTGRWDLVWAHAMLIGFFLSMASGVSYHVLSRWTTRRWRSVRAIRAHFLAVAFGLPLMLVALATNRAGLFYPAGMLQATALILFLVNALPLVLGLPAISKFAWVGAATCLTGGVILGASFAAHPELGARLRLAHAELNLFGWSGLLISGAAYYLIPRFAGAPLRWPRLAGAQIALLGTGVTVGGIALGARGYGHEVDSAIVGAQILLAVAFTLLGAIAAGTFLSRPGAAVTLSTPRRPAKTGLSVAVQPQRPS